MLIDHLKLKNCLELADLNNNCALTHCEIVANFYLKSVEYNHLYLPPIYTNIGNIYRLKGKYSQSLIYHLKSVNIREKNLRKTHIEIGQSLIEVALCYHDLGLNDCSITLLNRAKEIFEFKKLAKNDSRFTQLGETFISCQKN